MTGYLLAALAFALALAIGAAGVQSYKLSTVRSELADTVEERDEARAATVREVRARVASIRALETERAQAGAAAKTVADLKSKIARSAGTEEDSCGVAAILRETVETIGGLQ